MNTFCKMTLIMMMVWLAGTTSLGLPPHDRPQLLRLTWDLSLTTLLDRWSTKTTIMFPNNIADFVSARRCCSARSGPQLGSMASRWWIALKLQICLLLETTLKIFSHNILLFSLPISPPCRYWSKRIEGINSRVFLLEESALQYTRSMSAGAPTSTPGLGAGTGVGTPGIDYLGSTSYSYNHSAPFLQASSSESFKL